MKRPPKSAVYRMTIQIDRVLGPYPDDMHNILNMSATSDDLDELVASAHNVFHWAADAERRTDT